MSAFPGAPSLNLACHALQDGEVVACPTEAVWGLSCDPHNRDAVQRLLADDSRSIAEIAYRVGYQNYRDFYRNFVKYEKASPRRARPTSRKYSASVTRYQDCCRARPASGGVPSTPPSNPSRWWANSWNTTFIPPLWPRPAARPWC